jgi:hypothetical protein
MTFIIYSNIYLFIFVVFLNDSQSKKLYTKNTKNLIFGYTKYYNPIGTPYIHVDNLEDVG